MIRYKKVIAGIFVLCFAVPAGLSAQDKGGYSDPGGYSYPYSGNDGPTMTPLVPQERNSRTVAFPYTESIVNRKTDSAGKNELYSGDTVRSGDVIRSRAPDAFGTSECESQTHKHEHKTVGDSSYRVYKVERDGEDAIARKVLEFQPDGQGGMVRQSRGVTYTAQGEYDSFNPNTEGLKNTNGPDTDSNVVGRYHIWIYKGNIFSKGWVGSDENDKINFKIQSVGSNSNRPLTNNYVEGEGEEYDQWPTHCAKKHTGVAYISLYHHVETQLHVIGGGPWPLDYWYAGLIHPIVTSETFIENVGTKKAPKAPMHTEYQITVDPDREPIIDLSSEVSTGFKIGPVSGNLSARDVDRRLRLPPEAEIILEPMPRLLFQNPYPKTNYSTLVWEGPATSTAKTKWKNRIQQLNIMTNDMVATWEIRAEAKSILQITE
jgi:hypothetical protein